MLSNDPPCCALCQHADLNDLYYCCEWTGQVHSACTHAACSTCLKTWIDSKMDACRSHLQLTVPCFVHDCKRCIPRSLVLHVSAEARRFGDMMNEGVFYSKGFEACPLCKKLKARLVLNEVCGHLACADCWTKDIKKKAMWAVQQHCLDIPCCHPGCEEGCLPLLMSRQIKALAVNDGPDIRAEYSAMVMQQRYVYKHWSIVTRGTSSFVAPGPTCPICQERCVALLYDPLSPMKGLERAHDAACKQCWVRWFKEHNDYCIANISAEVPCMWPDCQHRVSMNSPLWRHCVEESKIIAELTQKFDRRARLQSNALYPVPMQVNCPMRGCVGLGYLGFDRVMCFMCEHQWSPVEGAGEAPCDPDIELIFGVAVKRCPKCQEYIEKNGGCDHMTCRQCRHEFYWTTLKAYRTR